MVVVVNIFSISILRFSLKKYCILDEVENIETKNDNMTWL